jgi:hypothetical protein
LRCGSIPSRFTDEEGSCQHAANYEPFACEHIARK